MKALVTCLELKKLCQLGAVFVILHSPAQVHSLKFKVQLQFLNQLVRGKSSGLNRGSWLKNAALKTAVLKMLCFISFQLSNHESKIDTLTKLICLLVNVIHQMPPKLDKHLVRLMAICDHVLDIQRVCVNQQQYFPKTTANCSSFDSCYEYDMHGGGGPI